MASPTHPPILKQMIADRYSPPDTEAEFPIKAYMRGFFYAMILDEVLAADPWSPRTAEENEYNKEQRLLKALG